MEPLDPKAELMRLADTYAVRNREQDEGDSGDSYDAVVESRAALRAAIIQALADARRQSEDRLQIALGALADISLSGDMTLDMARSKAQRIYEQFVDGKAGGT